MLVPNTNLPTPVTNPFATAQPPQPRSGALITEQPFYSCAAYTSQHVKMLTDAFVLLNHKVRPSGDWARDLVEVTFGLMAPALGTYMIVKSAPRSVAGALGTAALAPVYAVEWTGRKVVNMVARPPDAVQKQREHLMQEFVNKMRYLMNHLPADSESAGFFKTHPEQLINIVAINVAFLSRDEPNGLKVGNTILTFDQLKNQDPVRQRYFQDVCQIKEAIGRLSLAPDNPHAWNQLMKMLKESQLNTSRLSELEDEWTLIDPNRDYIQLVAEQNPHANRNLISIVVTAYTFSGSISKDPLFKKLWKNQPS